MTESLDHRFTKFLLEAQALKFGEFTLKSGRKSPYFINAGAFNDGRKIATLGAFYAEKIAAEIEAGNLPDDIARCEFMVNNSLSGIEPDRFTAILCNPPFHQQHAITDHIAWQMFNDARRSLKYGGELYVVGNRHLDYFRKLKRAFGNCTTIATNNKFVILKATKVRKQR